MVIRYMPVGCGPQIHYSRLRQVRQSSEGYVFEDDGREEERPIKVVPFPSKIFLNEAYAIFSVELPTDSEKIVIIISPN